MGREDNIQTHWYLSFYFGIVYKKRTLKFKMKTTFHFEMAEWKKWIKYFINKCVIWHESNNYSGHKYSR